MKRIALLASLLASALFCHGTGPPAPPTEVKPTNSLLRYNGRFDWQNPDAPCASFPGSALVVRFRGTALGARLSTTRADEIQVVVDGLPTDVLALTGEPVLYPVGHDLQPVEHTVVLFKRTERAYGTTRFLGLELPAGSRLLRAPRVRRNIEFIGDSITCGYGDEASAKEVPVSAANSDHFLSYAAVAARLLHAEHVAVAASGIRLTEAPGEESMPTVYHRIDPNRKDSHWDFKEGPMPDVVVINLATNDFRKGDLDGRVWKSSYEAFLDFIRAKRPNAHIFLTDGPMMEPDVRLEHLRQWNREIVARRRAAHDMKIHVLDFAVQQASDGYGSDWHPSVKTHARMADELVAAIKAATGW